MVDAYRTEAEERLKTAEAYEAQAEGLDNTVQLAHQYTFSCAWSTISSFRWATRMQEE